MNLDLIKKRFKRKCFQAQSFKIKDFRLWLLIIHFFFLPHPLLASSAKTYYGAFRLIQGDIQIISGQKPKVKKKAKTGMKVYPGDLILSSKNSKAQILMIDESLILLPPQSKIKIQKKNKNKLFNQKKNPSFIPYLIHLISGKIRSQVRQTNPNERLKTDIKKVHQKPTKGKKQTENIKQKKELKKLDLLKMNSYQIWTKSAVIGVRGTDFLVSFEPKENLTEVMTFEGEIHLYAFNPRGTLFHPVLLKRGQKIIQPLHTQPQKPIPLKKETQTKIIKEFQIQPVDKTTSKKPQTGKRSSLILREDLSPQKNQIQRDEIFYENFSRQTQIRNQIHPPLPQVAQICKQVSCSTENRTKRTLERNVELQNQENKNSLLIIKVKHEN